MKETAEINICSIRLICGRYRLFQHAKVESFVETTKNLGHFFNIFFRSGEFGKKSSVIRLELCENSLRISLLYLMTKVSWFADQGGNLGLINGTQRHKGAAHGMENFVSLCLCVQLPVLVPSH